MLQPKLVKVEPLPQMKLRLSYETGEIKVFDVEPYAMGSWFSKLKDDNYFKTVQMLPGGIGIEWPEGQDIAPHELYENSIAVKKNCLINSEKGKSLISKAKESLTEKRPLLKEI